MQDSLQPQSSLEVLAAAAQNTAQNAIQYTLQDVEDVSNGVDSPLDLSALLQDPSFLSAVATLQTTQSGSIYAQYLLDNMASSAVREPTPIQQTRSGRIVRPPLSMPTQTLFQDTIGRNMASIAIEQGQGVGKGERYGQDGTDLGESSKSVTSTSPRHDEDGQSAVQGKRHKPVLPQFPLPPTGPNGRKNMPKEEMLRRRRERNRVAAVTARQKRKQRMGTMEEQLREREEYCMQMEARCNELEKRVDELESYIISKGLDIPGDLIDSINNLPGVSANIPSPIETPASLFSSTTPGIPSLDMYLNIGDDDEEADGDFLPQSSPRREDSESETSDIEDTDRPVTKKRKTKKTTKEKDPDPDPEDDDEFIDPEVWDEDLFMPIEDVPVPPLEELADEAMRSMGAKTKDELREVVVKLVNQGRDGVTAEQLTQLKGLLTLMGARGVLSTGSNGT